MSFFDLGFSKNTEGRGDMVLQHDALVCVCFCVWSIKSVTFAPRERDK